MSGTAKGLNATASEWTPSSAGGSPTAPGAGIRGAGEYTSRRDGFGGGGGSYHPSYNGGGGNYGPGYSGGGGHAPMHHNNAAHGMHTPHHPHHHPAAHHSGPGGGFASHTAHSNFAPQHVAPGFGAPHHAPPPNQFPPNFGPRQPHAGQFAPHQPAWNNAVSMAPPPQTQRRPVILIMGAPKSGKKSLGEFLAPILGYAHIQPNPTMEWTERFDHVEREIAKNIDRCKGFIVSGYGAESDVDLYYLFHAVTKPRVAIHFVLYLDYTYIEMTKRLQSLDFTTTSPVMAAYATGYELCASHFSGLVEGFHNVQVMDGETPRSVKSIADECLPLIRKVIDNPQSAPVPAPKANAFDKWTLVTDHRLFRSLLTILDKALLTHTSDGVFPLRNPGGSIDYAKFARHYHQLQSYDVLLSTNGQRALIFKIGTNCIYALTEMCTCVYKLSDIPDTFSKHSGKGEDDLVFAVEADLCTIEHQGNTAAHVLLHDVLYYANRTMERVPWADRRDIILKQFGESSQQYVLPHVVHHIASISDLVAIITNIENIVVGFRFEHPYGYKASTALTDIDSRLLTWSDGEKPLVTLRVWSSTEGTRKVGNATEAYYRFEVLVVDDENGVEKPLQDVMLPAHAKVTGAPPVRNAVLEVPDHIVNSQQLNDGHIVECRYIRNPPPVIGKGPAARASQKTEWYAEGSWTFVRRRNDVLYPHYASTVNEAIKKPGWKRDELIAACSEIPARPPRPEA